MRDRQRGPRTIVRLKAENMILVKRTQHGVLRSYAERQGDAESTTGWNENRPLLGEQRQLQAMSVVN